MTYVSAYYHAFSGAQQVIIIHIVWFWHYNYNFNGLWLYLNCLVIAIPAQYQGHIPEIKLYLFKFLLLRQTNTDKKND